MHFVGNKGFSQKSRLRTQDRKAHAAATAASLAGTPDAGRRSVQAVPRGRTVSGRVGPRLVN